MLMKDYTSKLLNLKGVIITNVENIADQLHIYIELPKTEHTCPVCGAKTDRIHDYRMQVIKDIPMSRNTFLHLRKRRYCCNHCNKRFFENNDFLPRYYRMTSRLISAIIHAFRKVVSATEISSRFNVSVSTAIRYFDCVNYHCRQLPEVLSIEFLEVMHSDSSAIRKQKLISWLQSVEVMDLPEFRDCTKACRNWFHEILNSLDVPWTNGFTEGCNNKTKILKRNCFGVRNFERFRNRILPCNS